MRKLMWFTIGFAVVCAVCAYGWFDAGLLSWSVLCLAGALGTMLLSIKWKSLRPAAAVFLGGAAALCWFQLYGNLYLSRVDPLDDQIADTTLRCTEYSVYTDSGTAVEGILYLEGKPYRARLYVSGQIEMEPGDILTGAFRFRVTTPEGGRPSEYFASDGIFLLGYQQEDAELAKLAHMPWWGYPAAFRQKLASILDAHLEEREAGFVKALLLGDRSGIDYGTNTDLKTAGISHIIAVSGLHVTILFTLVYTLLLKRRILAALVEIPVLVFFCAMTGFSPSVVRAGVMMGLMVLAMVFNRDYDGPTELSFACLVMLLVNPLAVTSVSLQLSALCVAGMLLFRDPIQSYLLDRLNTKKANKRWKHRLASSVAATLSAMSLTTPLMAWYFGMVSIVSVLTNLLTLWIISFIFYGAMLLCLLGWLWPAAAGIVAAVVGFGVRYVLLTAKILASVPFAAVYIRNIYHLAWLVFCYVLLAVFLLSKNKKPGLLVSCGAFGLCLCLCLSWLEPMLDECRMTVLDVGQGQSIILQSGGKTFLVDCGGSDPEDAADTAAQELMSMGVFRLDGVIVTHFDKDHSGGVELLLERLPADLVLFPEAEGWEDFAEKVKDFTPTPVQRDIQILFGNTVLTIFGPVVPDSGNESSLAVLFQGENCDILITGDRSGFGERLLLKTMELPELEVLVAGHHGAANATSEELLEATRPEAVYISVGTNAYGQPSQEVLERLTAIGCQIFRTDRDGTITFRR